MGKGHNGIISFWKFIFSLLIVALHLGIKHPDFIYNFKAGSIAVEFFFIVSGYLFCFKCLNTNDNGHIFKDTSSFFMNKIKKFLPYIVFLWLLSIPYVIVIEKYGINDFIYAFYNLLYIPVKDNPILEIFGITWYIAAMIIVESILYPIIVKYKNNFIHYFSPIIAYFGMNYLLLKFGKLAVPRMPSIICYSGLIRAMVGINLGMLTYLVSNKLKDINFTKFSSVLLTLFEIFGYLSIFVLVNKYDAHNRFDVLMILILFICISISFSTKSLCYNISNNKLFYTLEKLSLSIYLNQWLIIFAIEYYLTYNKVNLNYFYELFIIILILMIIAIIEEIIISFYKKKRDSIIKLFINNN